MKRGLASRARSPVSGPSWNTPPAPRDTRYIWSYIFGAVCPERAEAAALIMPHADTQAMSAHLAEIAKTVASGAHALLILDGAGWHGSAELEVPDNITLLKLPPYSPELNPMENVWAYLRANKLAISVFDNYEQIVDRCCAWNFFANAKPQSRQSLPDNGPKRSTTRAVGITLGVGLGMVPDDDPHWHRFFRIGHMGHVNAHMVMGVLGAVDAGLKALGVRHGTGAVEAAATEIARV